VFPGTIFNPLLILETKIGNYSRYLIKLFRAGAAAGAAIRICGSAEQEPKETFSAPQDCAVHNFTVLQHIDTVDASKASSEGSVPQPIMMNLELT
jgi:hypothetical protein